MFSEVTRIVGILVNLIIIMKGGLNCDIPLIQEQLFYKYFVCVFNWLGYKRHNGFEKL